MQTSMQRAEALIVQWLKSEGLPVRAQFNDLKPGYYPAKATVPNMLGIRFWAGQGNQTKAREHVLELSARLYRRGFVRTSVVINDNGYPVLEVSPAEIITLLADEDVGDGIVYTAPDVQAREAGFGMGAVGEINLTLDYGGESAVAQQGDRYDQPALFPMTAYDLLERISAFSAQTRADDDMRAGHVYLADRVVYLRSAVEELGRMADEGKQQRDEHVPPMPPSVGLQ